jgi:poly(hydroxyalkanoate) depolymerase family esterase
LLRYRLFVPPGASEPAPMIVALHGCTQSASDFAAGTRFDELAAPRGAFVLYPEQSRSANPQGCWNWFLDENQRRGSGEPAEILERVEFIAAHYPIDRSRVYVAGLSAGGAMAAILAEQAPDVFAAAGIVAGIALRASGTLERAYDAMGGFDEAQLSAVVERIGLHRPHVYERLRVMLITGDADQRVHPSNTDALMRQFAVLLGLRGEPVIERDGRIERRRWSDRNGPVRIEAWTVADLGHAWSGGSLRGSHTDPDGPDASAALLDFFLNWRAPR